MTAAMRTSVWRQASELALHIMGEKQAYDDPLAYWCLVELLSSFKTGSKK